MSGNSYALNGIATLTIDGEVYQLAGALSCGRRAAEPEPPRRILDWGDHTITATLKLSGRNNLSRWLKKFDVPSRCCVRPRSAKMRRARRLKYWRPQ